jgi:hypothetical protein
VCVKRVRACACVPECHCARVRVAVCVCVRAREQGRVHACACPCVKVFIGVPQGGALPLLPLRHGLGRYCNQRRQRGHPEHSPAVRAQHLAACGCAARSSSATVHLCVALRGRECVRVCVRAGWTAWARVCVHECLRQCAHTCRIGATGARLARSSSMQRCLASSSPRASFSAASLSPCS